MEFQTKIIEKKKNPRARVAAAGVALLLVAMILGCIRGYEHAAMWTFGVAMLLFVGGVIYAKGDLSTIEVSMTDIIVNVADIRVGDTRYPMDQLEQLEFKVEGYDGMVTGENTRGGAIRTNGMDNYVTFVYAGQKEEWQFYLADALHVQLLGGVFKELYAARVLFEERSQGWRTFLFEPVTEGQWEDLMIQNGYK